MPKKQSLASPINSILILVIIILAGGLVFIYWQNSRVTKQLNRLEQKTTDQPRVPSPDFEEWKEYTYNQGAAYGFTILLPAKYYLLEKAAPSEIIKYFTVFPTPEEKIRIGMDQVMEIEFNTQTGQIQFGSPQDTEWDRIYHGRVVRSFKLISNK